MFANLPPDCSFHRHLKKPSHERQSALSALRRTAVNHYPPWTARLAKRAEDAEEVLALVSPQTKFSTC